MDLKSITAYRQVDHSTHIDLDGTGYPIFGVLVDQEQAQFSQEIQLAFAPGDALAGLIGAYWFSETDVTPDGIRNSEPIDFAFGGGFFLPYNTVSENEQQSEAAAVFRRTLVARGGAHRTHRGLALHRRDAAPEPQGLPGVSAPPRSTSMPAIPVRDR